MKDVLHALVIQDWQSEPHQQQQNPAECCWQTVKNVTNILLDCSGAPAYCWLLCLLYVCFLLNHCWNHTINGIPIQLATGTTPDISPLLTFFWWQLVYYQMSEASFPSDSREGCGHWVGIAKNAGHAMTYKILTDDTRKVIFCSSICAASPNTPNYHLDPVDREMSLQVVKSWCDNLFLDKISHTFLDYDQPDPTGVDAHPNFNLPTFQAPELLNPTVLFLCQKEKMVNIFEQL